MKAKSKTSAIFKSGSPEDTLRLAGLLAGLLKGGEVVSLKGMIGAGKTFFVQGLALALGSRDAPVSASFNLMRTYPTTRAGGRRLLAVKSALGGRPGGGTYRGGPRTFSKKAGETPPSLAGLNIYHFDLFRVHEAEMDNLGLEDYLGREDGFTAIEWSESARYLYRRGDFLEFDFELAGGDKRTIKASAAGTAAAGILKSMERSWRAK
ncbi:MAG: tRNA (adenosine(37)-N6)-threonylcarbamoyltransferase complex ATPase subunit type 1 TsaE [Elusimicrobia bacterium]|nr:tRNA (adenosine(37)-N6)-threonylcarbamoyltransferase complex ATPase subunit type 1 TsaE [Elusimicrobiota bacterium]